MLKKIGSLLAFVAALIVINRAWAKD